MIDNVKQKIMEFIISEKNLLPSDIQEDTPLISTGIIDSISTLSLVDFIETTFNIQFEPFEVDQENLNTVQKIADFILRKQMN